MKTLDEIYSDPTYQPFQKNGWQVDSFPDISIPSTGAVIPGLDPNFVQSISFSLPGIEAVSVDAGATNMNYPGNYSIQGPTFTVLENYRLEALSYMLGWLSTIRNPDSTYNAPTVFKKDIVLTLVDMTGLTVATVICQGCWPKGGTTYDLDTTSGSVSNPLAFNLDSVEIITVFA